MAQSNAAFQAQGELLDLWHAAQREFLLSSFAKDRHLEKDAEAVPNPGQWLKDFQNKRHKRSNKLSAACVKVGSHLETIQNFVRCVGFSVEVIAMVST